MENIELDILLLFLFFFFNECAFRFLLKKMNVPLGMENYGLLQVGEMGL